MAARIEVLLCYAREDSADMKELAIHLGVLERQEFFKVRHAQQIMPGKNWQREMEKHLMAAHIIVLLISQYFLNSDYCYDTQIATAVERHKRSEVYLLPVLLRPVYYGKTSFAHLQTLPAGGEPVRSRHWRSRDEAFYHVSEGIRMVAKSLLDGNMEGMLDVT